MKQTRADSDVCKITTRPRVWGGFGDSNTPLTTQKSARLSRKGSHNDSRSASLAVWVFIVPDSTMHHALLLGRDSYMRFDQRTYRTLPPLTPQSASRGELQLQHFGTLSGALAYKKNEHATGAAYHLRYDAVVLVSLFLTSRNSYKFCLFVATVCPLSLATTLQKYCLRLALPLALSILPQKVNNSCLSQVMLIWNLAMFWASPWLLSCTSPSIPV